jgi:hypothetical protein
MIKRIFAVVALSLFLASPALLAVGENVGRIRGVVREGNSKQVLSGATVTVTGPSLIGAPRTTVTGADGTYEIVNLPPGTYDVTVAVDGVSPVVRRVNVRANEATPVEVAWTAELQGEAVTITEERHATRPDSTETGVTFTMDKANNLPVARQYQSIVTLAPGVTQNASGNPYVKGANNRQNRILIDGLDTSDPLTNTFSANMNQDSLAAVQVITGGFEAKYNVLGSVQNLITNSGGDEFHFDVSFYTQQKATQDFFVSGANLYDGPRPFSGANAPPISRYSTSINVNGPIIKHKLWFSAGIEYDRTAAVTPAGPPLNSQAPSRVFADLYPRLKLTYAATEKDKFTLEGIGDPTIIDYAFNNGASANNTDPLSSLAQLQGGGKAIGEWDHFFSPDVDSKVLAGYSYSYIENGPQGYVRNNVAGYDFARSGHFNNDDGTSFYNAQQWQRSGRHRFQFDGALTLRKSFFGSHEAEFGYQSSVLQYKQETRNSGGGNYYNDRRGGPLTTGLCDADPALTPAGGATGNGCYQLQVLQDAVQRSHGWTLGFYAQDRYKPTYWLTILPGLRYDLSHAFVVDGGDGISLRGWGPRLAAIADLTGDEKTILQVSYGHSTEMTYLSPLNQLDGARKSVATTYTWNQAANGGKGAFLNPVATGGAQGIRFDTGSHVPPHADELLGSIRRELLPNTVGTIEYTYKRISNVIEFVEQNTIFDPSGNRIIGGRNGTPNSIVSLTFPDENKTYYSGLDFIFESRPTPALDVLASYTLSYTWGPGYQNANDGRTITNPASRTDQFANPRAAGFAYGYAPGIDTRHSLKTEVTYSFHGATIGTVLTWRSGIAQRKQFAVAGTVPPRSRTPNGLEPGVPNDVNFWTEVRTPDAFIANLSATYDFFELTHQHLIAQATVFNLFDSSVPTGIQTTDTAPPSRYGQVTTRTPPLSTQFGLRYQY